MDLTTLYLTNNNCYKAGNKLTPKGVMVHSTGANNPNLKRYVGPDDGRLGVNEYGNHWNQPTPDGREVCVHGFIGKLKEGAIATYQTLPWEMRAWHCGGSGNGTHIGFEICEDGLTDSVYFARVYKEAMELSAYLCTLFGLDPLNDGVLIDHSEGWKRGIASNHADVGYWFKKFGKSMDMFRSDVKDMLNEQSKGDGGVLTTMKVRVEGTETKTIDSILREGLNYPNLRELAELLDYAVGYDADTKVVTLTRKY